MEPERQPRRDRGAPAVSRRILIIDDSPATTSAMAKAFAARNYAVRVAAQGADALQLAAREGFDAILVDIHLPDLNGLLVSQKLRTMLGPLTPIVVISGDTSMEVINSLAHAGATYFFSKPLPLPHLMDRLNEWIAAADAQRHASSDREFAT